MTNGEKALNKAIDLEKSKDERFNQKLQHWDYLSNLSREELIGLCMTYRFEEKKHA
jgi:hypothetical protein|tara:strand:+ start:1249 stop:1416 length:168 start_codon:yes stop_codon:yes gene_type:complete